MTVIESYFMIKAFAEILGVNETTALKLIARDHEIENEREIVEELKKQLIENTRKDEIDE